MKLHPLCTLFPRMEGAEFEALKKDIKANGLRSPIVVHKGMVLDGGNRFRACADLGIKPETVEFAGGNIVSFVLSANLHRRHMTAGQQAAIVASATDWAKAHRHGGDRKSDQAEALPLDSVSARAAVAGATERTQRDADKLVREHPKLAKQVAQGKKSLYRAVQETKPEPEPEDDGPSDEEIRDAEKAHADDLAALQRLLDADDKLRHLFEENKRLMALNRQLDLRINGLVNEKDTAIRMLKAAQRKLAKLEVAA